MKQFKTVALSALVMATLVVVGTALAEESKGKITRLDTIKHEFSMDTTAGGKLMFKFKNDIKVGLNGKNVKLSDLKVGDEIIVNHTGEGDTLKVGAINATRGPSEATGKITYLDTIKNQFTMEPATGGKMNFTFTKNVKVQLNDKNANLSDLKVGDAVIINYVRVGEVLNVNELRARR